MTQRDKQHAFMFNTFKMTNDIEMDSDFNASGRVNVLAGDLLENGNHIEFASFSL